MENPFGELGVALQIPDLWQAEAARLLREGTDVIVHAPTGAGKTRVFELVWGDLAKHGQLLYTVPTRALANDKRAEWQAEGKHVGIATGDVAEDLDAEVVVATLEAAFDQLTSATPPALLVVDEYQMISHPRRGSTYEAAIALAPPNTRLLLLSGSVENTNEVADWLTRLDRDAKVVATRIRPVPLEEMPFAGLPYHPPKSLSGGFWPKFVAGALMNNLGPLLVFATKRKEAEKIARAVVNSLPAPDPITLTHEQEAACGKTLARLITHRVAYHHSGLSFAARAGVIEPLAKAGQLRLVVATTGLAAGVNFSMRSIAIAGWHLYDGETERDLYPDELLQMFGRADGGDWMKRAPS